MSVAERLQRVRKEVADVRRRKAARPLSFAKRLPWQQVAWSLLGGAPWRSEWGPAPSCEPSLICVPCSNRVGKSTYLGMVLAAAITGRLPRFARPGEVWGGMPTLSDSVAVQRPKIEEWLGTGDAARWNPIRANSATTSSCRTPSHVLRLKAYEQADSTNKSGGAWESGKCQLIALDEPPPDHVVSAARTRLIDEDGVLLAAFTPLKGTGSALYRQCYEPWVDYRKRHLGAKWGEVSPGVWVISVGMRDNARSVGGFLPDARIDREEAELIAMGRSLEARVRYHGEWLDTSEDRLIPAEQLRVFWPEDEPRAGYVEKAGWVDTASSTKSSADETAVSIWGRSHTGELYQLASEHGRWEPHEKLSRIIGVLAANGCPNTWVDRQTGDMEFAAALNAELARRGLRSCVQVAEDRTLDKVTVANLFAPMVAAGQVLIRQEHLDGPESFGSQARLFSASYKGHDDTLDAGMKAALKLVNTEAAMHEEAARAMDEAAVSQDEDHFDDPDEPDWRMGSGLMGPD